MNARTLAWVLAGCLVLLGGSCVYTSCKLETINLPAGPQGEARTNRYLATVRMFERTGTKVVRIHDLGALTRLPDTNATLFFPTQRKNVNRRRSEELYAWADAGGHLAVVTWSLWDDPNRDEDPILDRLGVHQYQHDPDWLEEKLDEDENVPDDWRERVIDPNGFFAGLFEPNQIPAELLELPDACGLIQGVQSTGTKVSPKRTTETVAAQPGAAATTARFVPDFHMEIDSGGLVPPPYRVFESRFGTHLATFEVGHGAITALTDDCFLRSEFVAEHDHAQLAWNLARDFGRTGEIWFVLNEDYPGAATLAWRHGWFVIVSVAIAMALWLWSASRRFGPVRSEPPGDRRRLMEHIEAAGRFDWRHAGPEALREHARLALMAAVRARHPGWAHLDPARLAERLGELGSLPPERVRTALGVHPSPDADAFATHIATLEKIRKAL